LTVFATGLSTPWGMAFLPDGRVLVAQKGGTLVVVSANGTTVSAPLSGVPAVDASGQGGLLDVTLDPQFATNRRIYLSYSEAMAGANGTAVARGVLNATDTGLDSVEVIFRQLPKKTSTSAHYGSRLIFRPDGTLLVTLGERSSYSAEAQSLSSQLGKVVRINADGTVPTSNPFFAMGGNAAAVWSYGHRNPQAAALHPTTGELWVTEHGPQGGDEVNLALAARNFGWPNVSYGCPYNSPIGTTCRIGGGVHNAPYTPPLAFWYPTSTAPGGAMFYTGTRFPEWQGNFLVGGLAGRTLYRLYWTAAPARLGQEPFLPDSTRSAIKKADGWIYMISFEQIYRIDR
jgi:glucose/arabinose dehydrogenase